MASAVLAQHQAAFRNTDRARIDDLVRGLLLQVPILVDAGLVRERIRADQRLVGLRAEAR